MRYGNNVTPRFENLEERLFLSGGSPEDALFGGDHSSTFKYIDADGTAVSVTLKSGSGVAEFSGDNLHLGVEGKYISVLGSNISLEGISLEGTTNRSSLTFRTNRDGDGLATVGYIAGSEALGRLSGNKLDLVGQGILMTGEGYIGSVVLHDVRGGADIVMEGDGASRGVMVKAGSLGAGTDIISDSYLKKLTANEWIGGSLITPWAGSIVLKGDLGANISLSGQDSKGYSLGTLKAGSVRDLSMVVPGAVKAITVMEWLDTDGIEDSIQADWLGKLQTKGRRGNTRTGVPAIAGDFEANLILTGEGVPNRKPTLGRAMIAGSLEQGLWDINGDIGSIKSGIIGSGWTLDAAGYVKSLYSKSSMHGSPSALWFGKILSKGDMSVNVVASGQDRKGVSVATLQGAQNIFLRIFSTISNTSMGKHTVFRCKL